MPSNKVPTQILPLLRGAVDTFVNNPVIVIPFLTVAFIQLLTLEILYFFPRWPLSAFFNPIVATLWGGEFVHFPHHFLILPKLFQNVQVVLYIFVTCFLVAVAISIISSINSGHHVRFKAAVRDVLRQYAHILAYALLSFGLFFAFHKAYAFGMGQLLKMGSMESTFFVMKKVIAYGAPYVNLLIGTLVTTLFAFVLPAIVIENRKFFGALSLNFRYLWGSFWFIFLVVLLPTLLYVPVLLLRFSVGGIAETILPEIRAVMLVIGVLVTMVIDIIIYTAITAYYLLKKERA